MATMEIKFLYEDYFWFYFRYILIGVNPIKA